ncbi:MAG: hypothetical protein J6Z49_02420 [Kiritimatiellae bacterium]|nr:hypothetical protein [Kiritimatiellia bacterium]
MNYEYDVETDTWVPIVSTASGSYYVTITIPGYEPPEALHSVPATEADIGKVVGADGRVYASTINAEAAGTLGEAMIVHVDLSSGTGLAIALMDAFRTSNNVEDWASEWSTWNPIQFGEWRIPSIADWKRVFANFGGAEYATPVLADEGYDYGDFRSSLITAGGIDISESPIVASRYFTSDTQDNSVWFYDFSSGKFKTFSQSMRSASLRMFLAFDLYFINGYKVWSEANSLTGTWDAKDANGIYNVFRYAFNVPSGDFPKPLFDISFKAGKAVITTPELVNTEGFTFTILASDDIAGTENTESYPLSPDGTTVIEENGKRMRFFRLKADVAQPTSAW